MIYNRRIIGERIKEIRKSVHWTQKELASQLGVYRETVARWELGLRKPHPMALKLIELVTGIRL